MKKTLLTLLITCFSLFGLSAMPCFESYIPDTSGEYVYYKDNTFTRESYLGILYYNDATLQVRYYAPIDKANLLPEKNIELLVSVNPYSDHLEMVGENIISTIIPGTDDLDIVNYLHDILYEFTARRSKAMLISPTAAGYVSNKSYSENGIRMGQDFPQFGGTVDVQYDALIPLFNIKNIYNSDGSKVLECVTFGQLSSNEDSSFSNFNGFAEKDSFSPTKTKNKAKTKKVNFENQYFTIDEGWTNQLENCWSLGNDSLITVSSLPSFSEEELFDTTFILRKLLLSTNGAYNKLSDLELIYNTKKNQIKSISNNWQPNGQKAIISTNIITKDDSDGEKSKYDYFSISTYQKPYEERRSYFEKIVKSYVVK